MPGKKTEVWARKPILVDPENENEMIPRFRSLSLSLSLSLSGFHLGVSTCGIPLVVIKLLLFYCVLWQLLIDHWMFFGNCLIFNRTKKKHRSKPKNPAFALGQSCQESSRATAKRIKLKAHLGNTAMARLEAEAQVTKIGSPLERYQLLEMLCKWGL